MVSIPFFTTPRGRYVIPGQVGNAAAPTSGRYGACANRCGEAGRAAYLVSRGKNGLSGRLIAPVQARVAVLPPSVQVWVPLSQALRRTKLPL